MEHYGHQQQLEGVEKRRLTNGTLRASSRHQLPDGHRGVVTSILSGLQHEYRLEAAA
jgi:hypothetical protein